LDGRTFTGAWIETAGRRTGRTGGQVAPSRVRGLKRKSAPAVSINAVAPSRVRGLKLLVGYLTQSDCRRTFTGAWIETSCGRRNSPHHGGRTFTGAWIETFDPPMSPTLSTRRTFTGAWIETQMLDWRAVAVASHLHGCVD